MKEDIFYIGLENPNDFRKNLLEASKDLINFLKRHEKLKSIRAEKSAQMSKLTIVYEDIVSMLIELKADMPTVDYKDLPKREKKPEVAHEKAEKKAAPKPKITPVDRFEAELNEIEQKLKALS